MRQVITALCAVIFIIIRFMRERTNFFFDYYKFVLFLLISFLYIVCQKVDVSCILCKYIGTWVHTCTHIIHTYVDTSVVLIFE